MTPPIGLGTMRLSSATLDEPAALRILHEAIDRGIQLFDTADVYAPSAAEVGHNERLLAKATSERSSEVRIATKGGLRREGKAWIPDGRAKHIKAACEASLKALNVEQIALYQLHTVDPNVPLATSVRALAALQKQGKVRDVGLCNVRLEDIELARTILDVQSVQVELNPLSLTPLKNGVVRYCAEHGIALIAHSPLGGKRVKAVAKHRVLQRIGQRHGVSALEVALAWLRTIDPVVVPIPGATRIESLVSSLHALELALSDDDVSELDESFPAGAVIRAPRVPASLDDGREVVLFVGYPGAGKTTLSKQWVSRGYERLNRDEAGGTLKKLLPVLDEKLAAGGSVVLDNTYPKRESRFDVIEAAHRHRIPVRCVWLQTTLEQAQVNAVERMWSRYGRLLDPDEMRAAADPNTFRPDAQYAFRRELEVPRLDEGFTAVDEVAFARQKEFGTGKAVFIDRIDDEPRTRDVLKRYGDEGYRLIAVTFLPGASEERARSSYDGLDVDVLYCSHAPPAMCWCRKPLPGLGVAAIETYGLDPSECLVVGDSASDRGFADRLGFRVVRGEEFFGS